MELSGQVVVPVPNNVSRVTFRILIGRDTSRSAGTAGTAILKSLGAREEVPSRIRAGARSARSKSAQGLGLTLNRDGTSPILRGGNGGRRTFAGRPRAGLAPVAGAAFAAGLIAGGPRRRARPRPWRPPCRRRFCLPRSRSTIGALSLRASASASTYGRRRARPSFCAARRSGAN
jgi:hypothetical protein